MVRRWILLSLLAMFAVFCIIEWRRSYSRVEGLRLFKTTMEIADGAIYCNSEGTGMHWFSPFSIKGIHGGALFPDSGANMLGFYCYLAPPDFSIGVPFWGLTLGAVLLNWRVWRGPKKKDISR